MGDPFHLSPVEIAALTPWQVECIYFHDRDQKTGIPVDERAGPDLRTFFYSVWRKRGLPDHQIAAKWKEWRAEQKEPTNGLPPGFIPVNR